MKRNYLFLVLLFLSSAAFAQTGVVKGRITDEKGEAVFGATVMIEGTQKGTAADFDGNYRIDKVAPGEITLVCSFISYETAKKTIKVVADKPTQIDFVLLEAARTLESVNVTAKANRESENILLLDQRKAVV
ncbi:MAG: carboxypeptidase-like regulatory domain-containing protein, partial [Chitinophagaceae bacterium]